MKLVLLPLLLSGCGGNDQESASDAAIPPEPEVSAEEARFAAYLPPGFTVEMADSGRSLFVTCAVCHAADARGTQLGPSLRDQEWISGDGNATEIQSVIRDGVPDPQEFSIPMPVMGGGQFDGDQIRALTAYVYLISHYLVGHDTIPPDTSP